MALSGTRWHSVAISGTCLFGGRSARDLPKRARAQHELDLVPAILGNTGGNQAQSRTQLELDLIPQSSAITMVIKRNHDGNQAESRWQSSGITMAIKRNPMARSDGDPIWRVRDRSHPSKSRTICAATESCASVSTRNRSASRSRWHATRTGMRPMNSGSSPWRTCGEIWGDMGRGVGRRSEHVHAGRDAHGDAPDELGRTCHIRYL